ncbi:GNAT family N-acetyltransferase [Methanococcoides orientis]|uniref:GNAT family N-acetyltransferase n=1 Tax=Methanococcoides orientis TaxID=2822137 RepID=UPI001E2F173B|nr:GNAT family N-acetyltransferase [Methanococcoides orientis]UGV40145.1 GNAT family N-acetyltransferase [Methanococcoides orientis]
MSEYIDVAIREAGEKDGESVECLLSTYFLDMDEVPIDDFIVAEANGKIVGVAALADRGCCEIHSIAVHPNYRGNGIGSKMVSSIFESVNKERIYVRTTSPIFFRKLGFIELPMSEKVNLWDDCRECDRFDRCKQHVMCIQTDEV